MPPSSNASLAQRALSSALAAHGSARIQGLIRVSHEHPKFAPGWIALAEEHMKARRREEALTAAKKAMRLDVDAHRRFSPELAELARPLLPERKRDPALDAEAEAKANERRSQIVRAGRPAASGPAAQALQQAGILVGYHRRTRLEELSVEYADYAPIWLALAEETLAQKSVDVAMDAATRALDIDPSLEAVMSPPLARAWKYHRKEARRVPPSRPVRPASAPSASAHAGEASASGASPGAGADSAAADAAREDERDVRRRGIRSLKAAPPVRYAYGKVRTPPPAPTPPIKLPSESDARKAKPRLDKMLAMALGLRSREERITILQQLRAMDPDNDEVLFHLAKELALAERAEDARVAGDALRELSMDRYTELYDWAEKHWAAKARGEDPESEPAARAQPEPEPPPRPSSPPLTEILDGLDAESRLEEARARAEKRRPARERREARPSEPALRQPRSPQGTRPAPQGMRSAPQGMRSTPQGTRPAPQGMRPARPAGPSALHEHDDESTVRASRPPGGMDHSKENSEFNTVVMNVAEMQRLAEETRATPDHSAPPGVQAEPIGRPDLPAVPSMPVEAYDDDTHVDKGPPKPEPVPGSAATTESRPSLSAGNRLRKGPPDTRIDERPRGRLPFKNTRSSSELEFQPPSSAAQEGGSRRESDDIDDLLGSMLDDDRSATMPPWLSSSRPWAATPDKPIPAPRGREGASASRPGSGQERPTHRRAGPDMNGGSGGGSGGSNPVPRAHPRLIRKRPSNKGPKPG